jgi:hypothetical protein
LVERHVGSDHIDLGHAWLARAQPQPERFLRQAGGLALEPHGERQGQP